MYNKQYLQFTSRVIRSPPLNVESFLLEVGVCMSDFDSFSLEVGVCMSNRGDCISDTDIDGVVSYTRRLSI